VPAAAVPSKRKRSISNGRLLDVSGFRPSVIPKCRCGPAAWLESQKIAVPAATRYAAWMFASLADATQSRERFEQLAREHATPGGSNEEFWTRSSSAGPSRTSASACNGPLPVEHDLTAAVTAQRKGGQ
jgi:hypothetical protein